MKTKKSLLFIALLMYVHIGLAQVTQLELASGIRKMDFTSFSIRPLSDSKSFSVSTLAFFQKYHSEEKEVFDEIGVRGTLYWNIRPWLSLGPSLYYNSVAGFQERLSLMLAANSDQWIITSISSIVHSELTGHINGESFLIIQFTQPISKNWKFIASAQMLTVWKKFSVHDRSFQQVRTGLDFHNTQFGLAIDFDQYGPQPHDETSFGIFIRKTFVNN